MEVHLANGTSPESAADLAAFGSMAFERNEVRAAVRWFREAFQKGPTLTGNPMVPHRLTAVRAALRAAATVSGEEATRLRDEALRWLESDVTAIEGRVEVRETLGTSAAGILRAWQEEPDLAPVRAEAIENLPESERTGWQTLWRRVDDLLRSE
jgi:hypothetical protein